MPPASSARISIYRLNVFAIFVPPLRERKPDILLLADHFVEKFAREHGKKVKRISTPAIDMLASYHWPGNVRELANAIERAVVVCDGQVLHAHHLPPTLQTAEASGTVSDARRCSEALEAFEKDALQDALKSARGNRAKAARLLSTTERIFNYRVRKLRHRLAAVQGLSQERHRQRSRQATRTVRSASTTADKSVELPVRRPDYRP